MMTSLMNFIDYISEKEVRVSFSASKPYSDGSRVLRIIVTDARYFNHITTNMTITKDTTDYNVLRRIKLTVNDILKGRERHEAQDAADRI